MERRTRNSKTGKRSKVRDGKFAEKSYFFDHLGVLVELNEEGNENSRSVFDYDQLRSKILAPQEWNLLLEYFVYRLRQEERRFPRS